MASNDVIDTFEEDVPRNELSDDEIKNIRGKAVRARAALQEMFEDAVNVVEGGSAKAAIEFVKLVRYAQAIEGREPHMHTLRAEIYGINYKSRTGRKTDVYGDIAEWTLRDGENITGKDASLISKTAFSSQKNRIAATARYIAKSEDFRDSNDAQWIEFLTSYKYSTIAVFEEERQSALKQIERERLRKEIQEEQNAIEQAEQEAADEAEKGKDETPAVDYEALLREQEKAIEAARNEVKVELTEAQEDENDENDESGEEIDAKASAMLSSEDAEKIVDEAKAENPGASPAQLAEVVSLKRRIAVTDEAIDEHPSVIAARERLAQIKTDQAEALKKAQETANAPKPPPTESKELKEKKKKLKEKQNRFAKLSGKATTTKAPEERIAGESMSKYSSDLEVMSQNVVTRVPLSTLGAEELGLLEPWKPNGRIKACLFFDQEIGHWVHEISERPVSDDDGETAIHRAKSLYNDLANKAIGKAAKK